MNKKILVALTLLPVAYFHFACTQVSNSSSNPAGEIDIVDVRNSPKPEENLAAHKPHDVEVYRITFMEEGYKVRYYRNENDTLRSHEAMYMAPEDFSKAAYRWLSDTSVAIRLYNPSTNKEKKFTVFGRGAMSGIDTD